MADLSDFNPEFSSRLDAFKAALDKAGIGYTINSGYRSPEYQGQMFANHQAKQAGQPLPYPNVEAPSVVAPAWRSFHNYGLAADFSLSNPNDYARLASMAQQFGLTGIGPSDKGHIQLAGGLDEDISQYHLANWRPAGQPAPAQGAVAYAGPSGQPSRIASRPPGTSLASSPMDIVLQAESGDQNVANTHATTSSGQAQGYPQITTGTWTDFAPKAGVDLNQYPNPLSAPRDVQIKVASMIPLNRWAQSTVNAVLAKYPGIDTSQPLGQIQSAAINPSGAPTTPAGGPAAPAAPGQPGQPSGGMAASLPGYQPNSPGAKMTAKGLQQLAGGDQGSGGGEAPPMQPPMQLSARAAGGPMMMGPGGQNAAGQAAAQQALAQQGAQYGFLTQPSLAAYAPPARLPGPGAMPIAQASGVGMGLPGTTLNSPSQLQMALMTGALSPYDLYGNSAAGFGSQSYGQ